jgi:hypothetical protein
MMQRLHNLIPSRGHPPALVLSQYLEDDLEVTTRRRIEAHLLDCAHCRRVLASLTDTVQALGSISKSAPAGLADSIVAALRAERASPETTGIRSRGADIAPAFRGHPDDHSHAAGVLRTALHHCGSGPQLRLTLPITIVAGVVLSMVNMGGMLIHGRIDLGVCLMCASNFLVPFVALNLALLLLASSPMGGRGSRPGGRSPA